MGTQSWRAQLCWGSHIEHETGYSNNSFNCGSFPSYASCSVRQLHCSVQHPDPALQPAQRLAHGAAGAVSLPCNNRPGNEASIVIADLWRFRIHGFCRNCVGATTPADLRNNRPDCSTHQWLCKSTQIYPYSPAYCCTHTVWLTTTRQWWLCKSTQIYPYCCTHTGWLTSTQQVLVLHTLCEVYVIPGPVWKP